MGTSVLLAPFILPMIFAAIVKMLFDAEGRTELFQFIGSFFSEEAFDIYAELFRKFTSPEFIEQVKEPISQIIEGFVNMILHGTL